MSDFDDDDLLALAEGTSSNRKSESKRKQRDATPEYVATPESCAPESRADTKRQECRV